ncbi:DUF5105 domain-containing protein [Bacillus sp. XF8]|uniref:DUF5105 domain-containing protein n=1 Tax=Bacillus sp. XF8 TaxID=2819289 RepID=UPI001AA027F2|nr:DUF5105 domain-containing protein [Bacillus sp. XF8]MBO1580520.1 DUF5105 domain-containing protein [Bacillus sp. XF8]
MSSKKFMAICCTTILAAGILSGCNSKKTESKSEAPKVSEVGDTSKLEDVEMTLESAEFILPDQYAKPENDHVLKVEVTVKNKGDKSLNIASNDFALYHDDQKMKPYFGADDYFNAGELDKGKSITGNIFFDVTDGEKYELVYKKFVADSKKNKEEKITYKIDGEKLAEKAKDLQKPAEALNAYINAAFYDKDVDKLKTLTGEDSTQFSTDFEKAFKQTMESEIGKQVNDDLLKSLLGKIKLAIQKNVKYETNVLSNKNGKAKVEIKAKPIDISALESKMESEMMNYASTNPNATDEQILNQVFVIYEKLLQEVTASSIEEKVEVEMEKHGKNQWKLNPTSTEGMDRVFMK